MKQLVIFWKTATWTVLMLVLFFIPSHNIPGSKEIPHVDKAAHIILFAVFTFLYIRDRLKLRNLKLIPFKYLFSAFIVVLLFGMMVEIFQEFLNLGRNRDIMDVFYDIIGCFLGMVILFLKYGIRFRSL